MKDVAQRYLADEDGEDEDGGCLALDGRNQLNGLVRRSL